MDFDSWEPLYEEILEDFGFSRKADEEAAEHLSELLETREDILAELQALIKGKQVIVCGNAPSLRDELRAHDARDRPIIAADGASAVLLDSGIVPQIIVTDLDGPFPAILEANRKGSLVVVHAHGDNIDKIERYVFQLKRVLGTTQSRPLKNVYNFGGFTDGDRCVFLARHLGAASIELMGFDFEDESVTFRKKKKLAWARRLIDLLRPLSQVED